MKKIRIINDKLFELQLKATMRHLRNAHSQSQSGSALLLLTSVQNLYVVNFKVKCKAVLKFKVKTACIMTFCWYVCSAAVTLLDFYKMRKVQHTFTIEWKHTALAILHFTG